jgi:hypothetical protein
MSSNSSFSYFVLKSADVRPKMVEALFLGGVFSPFWAQLGKPQKVFGKPKRPNLRFP